MQYHLNGRLVPAAKAAVSVHDRGFLYGDGFTERLRAFGGSILEWDTHARRIEAAGAALAIDVPDDLRERIAGTLRANDLTDAGVRVSIARGGGPELTPDPEADSTVAVTLERFPRGGRYGEPTWETPAVLQTVTVHHDCAGSPTEDRLTALRARLEVARAATDRHQADEALLCDPAGAVAGGAASDLLFVSQDALRVPEAEPVGVTRPLVLDLARKEGAPVEPGRYSPGDVREASEAFLTNAVWGIRPVTSIDGISMEAGPVVRLLRTVYDELIEGRYYT